jgi:protein SCO1
MIVASPDAPCNKRFLWGFSCQCTATRNTHNHRLLEKINTMKWIWILVSLLIGAIVVVSGIIVINTMQNTPSTQPSQQQDEAFNGVKIISPAQPAQDFTLIDTTGQGFTRAQLLGKPTLFSFGFTHCPDICPTTLNTFRQIQRTLATQGDAVNFVFISVDGERDTPEVLLSKLQQLGVDDFVIGLTDTPNAVRDFGNPYGLDFIYGKADEAGNYNVDHTASYFLLDKTGNWIRQYAFGLDKTLIEQDLLALLATP